jgi:RNase P subunit RPR2
MQAYCVKCRKKVEARNAVRVTLKNGRPAMRGVCPKCGTKVFRIGQG